jgi:predicted O-linked N-acetylglucosamine transferase (SPINDLY family)
VAAPVAEADPVDPPPELAGKFVFAAFANVLKLSPRCVAAWKRVLDRAPDAILLFSPFSTSDRAGLQAVCRAAGIGAARIAFLDLPSGDPRLFRRYELAHAAMDTFPYGGGDTTLAALSMGVPVVTLAGKRHAERIGASILTHLGLADLVAQDEDAFVELALRMAKDAPWRETLVERVRNAMGQSDAHVTAHTRALEALYAKLAGPITERHPTNPSATPPD